MASKTIWVINPAAGSAYHGMVYRHYFLAKEWAAAGCRVIIISSSYSHTFSKLPKTTGLFTREVIDGIEYCWVRMPAYAKSQSFGRLLSIFLFPLKLLAFPFWKFPKPDHIIVSGPPHVTNLNGYLWAKWLGATYTYEVRDIWPLTLVKLGGVSNWHPLIVFLRIVERFAYECADRVVSVLSLANLHFEKHGMDPEKFSYIPNGYDLATVQPPSRLAEEIKSKYSTKKVVIYTGTIGLANHIELLIESARLVKNPDLQFVIIGAGAHKEKLQKESQDLSNVVFYDSIPKDEVATVLKCAQISIITGHKTSLYEFGLSPNKIFDYMAAKLPIIMAMATGDDIIAKAGCGKTVLSCDAKELAQTLDEYSSKPDIELREMGESGYRYLAENHNYSRLAHKYLDMLTNLSKPRKNILKISVLLSILLAVCAWGVSLVLPGTFQEGIPSFLPDQIAFHHLASEVAAQGWGAWKLRPQGQFPAGVLSFFYLLAGGRSVIWLGIGIYAICLALSAHYLRHIFRRFQIMRTWWEKILIFSLLITPTTLAWWIYPHKDTYILPGFLMFVCGVLLTTSSINLRGVSLGILGGALICLNKPYFAQLFFIGLVLSVLVRPKQSLGRVVIAAFLLMISLSAKNYGEEVTVESQGNHQRTTIESNLRKESVVNNWKGIGFDWIDLPAKKLAYTRERFLDQYGHGTSSYHPELLLDSTLKTIKYFPKAVALAFLEPLPWNGPTGHSLFKRLLWHLLQFEVLLNYFSFGILIWRWKIIRSSKSVVLLLLALPFLVALGFAVPNVGTINRYRWPFLLLLKLVALEQLWKWWRVRVPVRVKKIVLFHGPDDLTFIIQRLVMARALEKMGYEIHVACPDTGHAGRIKELGFHWHPIDLNRGGLNPFRDLRPVKQLVRLLRDLKPDVLQNISIKPVIYGSLAGGMVGLPRMINLINGLGYAFEGKGVKGKIVMQVAKRLYGWALTQEGMRVIFQNPDDQELLVSMKLVEQEQTVVIRGSGVDQEKFKAQPLPKNQRPRVVFISRLIWSKGVGELAQAVKNLKAEGLDFEWVIVGVPDDRNPDSVPLTTLEDWQKSGVATWLGRQTDMPRIYAEADIVCLPSYYREGVPLTLLEAASSGRPLVAADSPGTREPVEDGVNGFLVTPRDVTTLTDALRKLLKSEEMRIKMGAASSEIVTKHFSSSRVQEQLIALYNSY